MNQNEENQLDALLKSMLKSHVLPEKAPTNFVNNVMGKLDAHILPNRKPSPLINPRIIFGVILSLIVFSLGLSIALQGNVEVTELPYQEVLQRYLPRVPRGWGFPTGLMAGAVGLLALIVADRFLKKFILKS
jgi:hypothetical protein